jgi:hypothetical protein
MPPSAHDPGTSRELHAILLQLIQDSENAHTMAVVPVR